jgi:hypothetical protein
MASKIVLAAFLQNVQAAVYSATMTSTECFSATKADGTTANGQWCLSPNSWTSGQCCDFSTTPSTATNADCKAAPHSDGTAYLKNKALCGRKELSNKFLRDFLTPSNTQYCPTTFEMI